VSVGRDCGSPIVEAFALVPFGVALGVAFFFGDEDILPNDFFSKKNKIVRCDHLTLVQ